jgi:hypothetical protein
MTQSLGLKALFALSLATALAVPVVNVKALFYDPAFGDPAMMDVAPSAATRLTPVRTSGIRHVGVHYWFEDAAGKKFADPAAAGVGTRIKLHLRGNVAASLSVWMSDATHDSIELTSRTWDGPEGGYRLARDTVFVVAREFVVAAPGKDAERVIIFLGRSQTEQVDSMALARERLQLQAERKHADGDAVLVHAIDPTTPGQIGAYVVNRNGDQAAVEIVFGSSAGDRELISLRREGDGNR